MPSLALLTTTLLLTLTLLPPISALPFPFSHPSTNKPTTSLTPTSIPYTPFLGNGSPSNSWPPQSSWLDFPTLFTLNTPSMRTSCTQFSQPNNSPQEIQDLRTAIESTANTTKVDKRLILAIVMQESGGCVRVPTTEGVVANPGLMQDHGGEASCAAADAGAPCPANEIKSMIQEGTAGTSAGTGLQQALKQAEGTFEGGEGGGANENDAQAFYVAARIYNSGSVATGGDLGAGAATHCYASDVANRLVGWVEAERGCVLDG